MKSEPCSKCGFDIDAQVHATADLQSQVEQLRGEVARWRACVSDSIECEQLLKQEALKVLPETQVGGDSYGVPGVAGIGENLVVHILKLRTALEKCVVALERVWEVEEMGYAPDDPESESGVSVCDKCEGVQHHNHKSHAENCPQPIIEDALATAKPLLNKP